MVSKLHSRSVDQPHFQMPVKSFVQLLFLGATLFASTVKAERICGRFEGSHAAYLQTASKAKIDMRYADYSNDAEQPSHQQCACVTGVTGASDDSFFNGKFTTISRVEVANHNVCSQIPL